VLKFVGILGFAKACPEIIKNTSKGLILSVNRQEVDKIKAAFLLSGKDICIKNVSGILKKL
jgi:RNase P/RNase MRP subunit POP5